MGVGLGGKNIRLDMVKTEEKSTKHTLHIHV